MDVPGTHGRTVPGLQGADVSEPDAAGLLRAAAAGRREYARGLDGETGVLGRSREDLELQASTLEQAARVVEGDLGPLYGWLPSWRWTDEMERQL